MEIILAYRFKSKMKFYISKVLRKYLNYRIYMLKYKQKGADHND